MMKRILWIIPVLGYICLTVSAKDLKGFDDSILFKVNWPGRDGQDLGLLDLPGEETLLITTSNNEKYKCILPHFQEKEKDSTEMYNGPSAFELISPLLTQSSCSYRLESYWTYELCHGQHVRQYHEEREGKKVKVQEYFLGRWDDAMTVKLKETLAEDETNLRSRSDLKVKKIDGLSLPYLQLNMTDGTHCDLNETPRQTKLLYVCYPLGKHEIYSLKETSTCEYEVIVLSPLLCQHPKYKPQESGENIINCRPVDGAAKRPKSVLSMEAESLKMRHQKISDEKIQKVLAVFPVHKIKVDKEVETRVRVEIHPVDLHPVDLHPVGAPELLEVANEAEAASFVSDPTPVINFLTGKNCLHGGSGWWKYEFCYGKSVDQYHIEKDSKRTVIHLGKFIAANHLDWLERNPHKRPKTGAARTSISHFYSMGSTCDETGQPRQTEVKLKCTSSNASPTSVGLSLHEPHTCQYVLSIESPLICKILHKADENGLIHMAESIEELAEGATVTNGYDSDFEDEYEEDAEDGIQDLDIAIPNGDE